MVEVFFTGLCFHQKPLLGRHKGLLSVVPEVEAAQNLMISSDWRARDILDLEFFLEQDRHLDEEDLKQRDRRLFLQELRSEFNIENQTLTRDIRRKLILSWVRLRRQEPDPGSDHVFPGEIYHNACYWLVMACLVFSFMAGVSVCTAFFTYTGSQPLNVAWFLAVTVGLQLLLLMGFGIMAILQKLGFGPENLLPYRFLSGSLHRLVLAFYRRQASRISGDARLRVSRVIGIVRSRHTVYGLLFFWPLFVLVQLSGIGFNTGILASTGFRILFSDTAFGWQSTLQVSGELVHRIVAALAAPWSWLGGPAIPTLEQVYGSRLILKDGIYRLATDDLISWWPFLVMCVLVYGLLPRLLLFISGMILLRRSEAGQMFNHADCDRLVRRLITQDRPDAPAAVPMIQPGDEKPVRVNDVSSTKEAGVIALVPDEVAYDGIEADLGQRIRQILGLDMTCCYSISMDEESDFPLLKATAPPGGEDPACGSGIVLVQEAWQPPILQTLEYIRNLRRAVSTETPLIIALVGKPEGSTVLTPPDPLHRSVWAMKIETLADPFLQLLSLVTP